MACPVLDAFAVVTTPEGPGKYLSACVSAVLLANLITRGPGSRLPLLTLSDSLSNIFHHLGINSSWIVVLLHCHNHLAVRLLLESAGSDSARPALPGKYRYQSTLVHVVDVFKLTRVLVAECVVGN